jgi:hypothetical protein
MSQSSIIFGALFVGFLVYITMKGELQAYAAVFKGTASTGNSVTSPIASSAPAQALNSGVQTINSMESNLVGASGIGWLQSAEKWIQAQ